MKYAISLVKKLRVTNAKGAHTRGLCRLNTSHSIFKHDTVFWSDPQLICGLKKDLRVWFGLTYIRPIYNGIEIRRELNFIQK